MPQCQKERELLKTKASGLVCTVQTSANKHGPNLMEESNGSLIQTSAPYLHPAVGRSAPADRLIGHISYLNCVTLAISCRAALLRVPSVVAATVKSNKLLMFPL